MLLLTIILMGCTDKDSGDLEEGNLYRGDELVEMYNQALCRLYGDIDCALAMGSCVPVVSFADEAACMTSQSMSISHCSNIPGVFYEIHDTVVDCIDILNSAECTAEELCPTEEGIIRYGSCEAVADALVQNCDVF